MSVGDPRRRGISSKNVIGIHGLQWQQAPTSDVAASFVWRLRFGSSLLLRSANVWSVLKMLYKEGKVDLRMPSASRGYPGAPKAATIRSLSSPKIQRLASFRISVATVIIHHLLQTRQRCLDTKLKRKTQACQLGQTKVSGFSHVHAWKNRE